MAKVDKSQYSKAQWKIVQAERRRQKELDRKLKAQKKLEKQIIKLPDEVIWCRKCAMSNQRPRIIFNEQKYF